MHNELKPILENIFESPVFSEEWDCDLLATLSPLIGLHNKSREENGLPLEAKFTNLREKKLSLSDLLMTDFEFLKRSNQPSLEALSTSLRIFEIHGPDPTAQTFPLEYKGSTYYVIGIRTPLIYFLHSFFSKAYILCCDDKLCDCLEEHDGLLLSEDYSDATLLAGIFNDIEVFFNEKAITKSVKPLHLASPYNYYERVEGARRFILAHEIGHHLVSNEDISTMTSIVEQHMNLDRTIAKEWATEFCCDRFALFTLLSIYGSQVSGPQQYELEQSLIGIMLFFHMLDIVDLALQGFSEFSAREISKTHPTAIDRSKMIYYIVRSCPVYNNNPAMAKAIEWNIRRLATFRGFMGGLGIPIPQMLEFRKRLTPFGDKAYRSIFYGVAGE